MDTQSSEILETLRAFRCLRLRVEARVTRTMHLPPYLGSTIRGAFGLALRQSCCVLRRQECSTCMLRSRCVYCYVFETPLTGSGDRERRYASAPHPFVLDLDMVSPGVREAGGTFSFGVTLIGRAVDFLPYFVHAFQRMGELGLGRGRGTFELSRVVSRGGGNGCAEAIYSDGELRLPQTFLTVEDALLKAENAAEMELRFETPVRFVERGELCREPRFRTLVGHLLRRLENLARVHCDGSSEWIYGSLLERAAEVELTVNETRWHDWERYSGRQDRKMKLGGLVGRVVYRGDLPPFEPLLALGRWIHVGKSTSFGLGRYEVARV